MITHYELLSLCTESHQKTKFGISYVEKLHQKPTGERFTFILFQELQYAYINNIILDLISKCYSLYDEGNHIKMTFSGYKSGIISVLVKVKNRNLLIYRSLNFSIEQQSLIYPSLFLNKLGIKRNQVKKLTDKQKPSISPIFETLHIAGNNVKVFCKSHKNNDLFLINVKMLN